MEKIRLRQASSMSDVQEFLEAGREFPVMSWDLETSALDPHPDKVVGHCVAFTPDEGMYIPTNHVTNEGEYLKSYREPTAKRDRLLAPFPDFSVGEDNKDQRSAPDIHQRNMI